MKKEYWITNSRFRIIIVVLFIMWFGVMVLFYAKSDEVTKNPCSICAAQQSTAVSCTLQGGGLILNKVYYPDFSIGSG